MSNCKPNKNLFTIEYDESSANRIDFNFLENLFIGYKEYDRLKVYIQRYERTKVSIRGFIAPTEFVRNEIQRLTKDADKVILIIEFNCYKKVYILE